MAVGTALMIAQLLKGGYELYQGYQTEEELKKRRREAEKMQSGLDMTSKQLYYGNVLGNIARSAGASRQRTGARAAAAGVSGSSTFQDTMAGIDATAEVQKGTVLHNLAQYDLQVKKAGRERVDRISEAIGRNRMQMASAGGDMITNIAGGYESMQAGKNQQAYEGEVSEMMGMKDGEAATLKRAMEIELEYPEYGKGLTDKMGRMFGYQESKPAAGGTGVSAGSRRSRIAEQKAGLFETKGYRSAKDNLLFENSAENYYRQRDNRLKIDRENQAEVVKLRTERDKLQGKVKDLRDREVSDWVDDYFSAWQEAIPAAMKDYNYSNEEKAARKNKWERMRRNVPESVKDLIAAEIPAELTTKAEISKWLKEKYGLDYKDVN